jgi:hypothetical protein
MSDEGATPDDEAEDWNSGPFCRHWGDPSDCNEKCAACGHWCSAHSQSDTLQDCRECDCAGFTDDPPGGTKEGT